MFLKCTQNNNAKTTTTTIKRFIGHQGRHTFDGDSTIVLAGLSVGVVVITSDLIDSQSLELFDDVELQSTSSSNVVDVL